MIRVNLDSARAGVLYHFTGSMNQVFSIMQNGLRTSSLKEAHMRSVPRRGSKRRSARQYAENPESAFVSLARSPSIVYNLGKEYEEYSGSYWKYAVIFNADRLSDIAKITPYHYSTSNREFSMTVAEDDKEEGGIVVQTDVSPERFFPASGDEPDGETPFEKFMDGYLELENYIERWEDAYQAECPVQIGSNQYGYEVYGELSPKFPFSKLPRTIQNLLSACGFESEDRALFPDRSAKEFVDGTKKAIVGILVPDNEYWSDSVNKFRTMYPNMPVYAYRRYSKKDLPAKPIPKSAYKLPTV